MLRTGKIGEIADLLEKPVAPKSVEETGIGAESLMKLVAKTLDVFGTMVPSQLGAETCLPTSTVLEILGILQKLHLVEAKGLAGADMRSELRYALSERGHEFAGTAMMQSQYVGPAPVALDRWIEQIKKQTIEREQVSMERLSEALSHLVLPEGMAEMLGPAVNSARSILLYGKPGNGKTSIAEAVGHAFAEVIYIPHAVEIAGQIITVFDPTVHEPAWPEDASDKTYDKRWVPCRRPLVITGGELTLDMLEMSYNPVSRFYEAPLHVKALGGVFIVDDFGRQRTDPQSILNRWIVPLERRYDFLTLHTGRKFAVPFDQLAIFSTNIPPDDLADAGGLRRLYYKMHIPSPTQADYLQIFSELAQKRGMSFDKQVCADFYEQKYVATDNIPSGYHPRYIVEYIFAYSKFNNIPPRMDPQIMEIAFENMSLAE